jgi:putative phosphoribosyl transferase
MRFSDRSDAGRRLAAHLEGRVPADAVVLGLPRGGVPVALEVARAFGLALDVIVVRKVGVPWHPELAMGAIGEDGVRVVDAAVLRAAGVTAEAFDAVERTERAELERRAERFRRDRPRTDLSGRTALIVDDGIATGSTARAACQVARAHGASRVILAAPVGPIDAAERLAKDADEVVILRTPEIFGAVGQFYADFAPVPDEVVARMLDDRVDPRQELPRTRGGDRRPVPGETEVAVDTGSVVLAGSLTWPERPVGVVVFAHGSGSSRHSPRNRRVATVLNRAGLGTLLLDLLTVDEEADRANVFDVELLGRRLRGATAWLARRADAAGLPIGYFGASTGAAAALWAAARADADAPVAAVVSRGGRPDLAGDRLAAVTTPTLLIVGSLDTTVLELNRQAARAMRGEVALAVVPGATHLFEEPGTLDVVAGAARDWFVRQLADDQVARSG